jgi:hypothetical protein
MSKRKYNSIKDNSIESSIKDNSIDIHSNKIKSDEVDFSYLWGQQPFWEMFFEYMGISYLTSTLFILVCKDALETHKKYCYKYVFDKTYKSSHQDRFHLSSKYIHKYFPNLRVFILTDLYTNEYWNKGKSVIFPGLKTLIRINVNEKMGADRINFASVPNLKTLIISNTNDYLEICQEDVEYHGTLPYMHHLKGIGKCNGLVELMLGGYYCIDDRNMEEIGNLINLEKLDLSQFQSYFELYQNNLSRACLFTDKVFNNVLNRLTNLKSLSLNGCYQIKDFSFLKNLYKLEELNLSCTLINNKTLLYLKDKQNLSKLSIIQSSDRLNSLMDFNICVDTLSSLKQITHLCLPGFFYYDFFINDILQQNDVDPYLVMGKYILPNFAKFSHLKSICIYNSNLLNLDELEIANKILTLLPNIETIYLNNHTNLDLDLDPKLCCKNCTDDIFYTSFRKTNLYSI